MKQKVLAIVVLFVMLASIPVGVYLVKKRQEIQLRAAPSTVLSLEPAAETYGVDEVFTINVQIDTGTNIVAAADIDLSYDPQVLSAEDITSGTFFDSPTQPPNELRKDLNTPGKIYYSIGSLAPKQGSGTLASISFKGIAEGTSAVTFDDTSQVGDVADPEGGNVLANTIPGSYLIAEGGIAGTPTETPTPTEGQEPTTTITPTGLPTEAPTEAPTPTTEDGTGGGQEPTNTPTPTEAGGGEPTPTATPTTAEELPETGIPTPTIFLLFGSGIFLALSFLRFLLY
ncbi:hypothetical protein GTO10_01065 [Candidatus Saccharibacteria bacterium]|nr:hypothetical protein [Candidatus Saccharibacteria bacterium]